VEEKNATVTVGMLFIDAKEWRGKEARVLISETEASSGQIKRRSVTREEKEEVLVPARGSTGKQKKEAGHRICLKKLLRGTENASGRAVWELKIEKNREGFYRAVFPEKPRGGGGKGKREGLQWDAASPKSRTYNSFICEQESQKATT